MPPEPKPPPLPRWRNVLIWLTCALALTSCARGTPRTPAPPAALVRLATPLPQIDRSLLAPIPPPPPATDDLLPTLIRNHLAVADTAHQCLIQRAALIDAVRARELSERERSDAVLQALGTQGGRADGGRR